jgi:hypothetical protein
MFMFHLGVNGTPSQLVDLVACGLMPSNAYVRPDGHVHWGWETQWHEKLQDALDEALPWFVPHVESCHRCVERGAIFSVGIQHAARPGALAELRPYQRAGFLDFGAEAMSIIALATQMFIIIDL